MSTVRLLFKLICGRWYNDCTPHVACLFTLKQFNMKKITTIFAALLIAFSMSAVSPVVAQSTTDNTTTTKRITDYDDNYDSYGGKCGLAGLLGLLGLLGLKRRDDNHTARRS